MYDAFEFHRKIRHLMCKDCSCGVNKDDPCSKCPKNNWDTWECMPKNNKKLQDITKNENIFPSTQNIISNFMNAIVDESRAIVLKQKSISKEQADERYNICKKCDFFEPSKKRCFKCGCFMPTKTLWRSQKCPIGKW